MVFGTTLKQTTNCELANIFVDTLLHALQVVRLFAGACIGEGVVVGHEPLYVHEKLYETLNLYFGFELNASTDC